MSIWSKRLRSPREPRQSFFAQAGEVMRRNPPTRFHPKGGSIWYALVGGVLYLIWRAAHSRLHP